MALYPISTLPLYGLTIVEDWPVEATGLMLGGELAVRRGESLAQITVDHGLISAANLGTLQSTWRTAYGGVTAVTFVDPRSKAHTNLYVGTGDGSTLTYDLPIVTGSSSSLYGDGSVINPAGYTYNAGTGTDGRDSVTFSVARSAGVRISQNVTGYRAYWVKFASAVGAALQSYPARPYQAVVVELREVIV